MPAQYITVGEWLKHGEILLQTAGIGTARLDALVLLEDAMGHEKSWLLAHPEAKIDAQKQAELKKLLNLRALHQPLAYVRGKTEFYGREFVITPAVLEPRPESETMIDWLKKLPDLPEKPRIVDVGAGSGALGITAKLELPQAEVVLLEIDPEALKVAKTNVDLFTLTIRVIKSDLLAQGKAHYDVLLCNLPYVPDSYQINQAAMAEPRIAIFGGPDGLDLYRKLFRQTQNLADGPLYILTESLPPQHDSLQQVAGAAGYQMTNREDFIQVFKKAV